MNYPTALLIQVQLVFLQHGKNPGLWKDRCNQQRCLESMKGHRENDFLQLIMIYQHTTLLVELLFLMPNGRIVRGKLYAYSLHCSHFSPLICTITYYYWYLVSNHLKTAFINDWQCYKKMTFIPQFVKKCTKFMGHKFYEASLSIDWHREFLAKQRPAKTRT